MALVLGAALITLFAGALALAGSRKGQRTMISMSVLVVAAILVIIWRFL